MANLTSFERDLVFSALIGQDDRHCLPFDAAMLRSEIFPARPFIAIREIATARDKLVALGVFIRKAGQRKEWLEIHPEYRHSEGQNETNFGEEPEQHEQTELRLLTDASRPRGKRGAAKFNPSRTESEQSRADESGRRESAPIRERALGGDSESARPGRFASDEEAINHPAWPDVCLALGGREILDNGKMWEKRFRENPRAMIAAMQSWKTLSPEERAKSNVGRYMTSAFTEENQHRRTV